MTTERPFPTLNLYHNGACLDLHRAKPVSRYDAFNIVVLFETELDGKRQTFGWDVDGELVVCQTHVAAIFKHLRKQFRDFEVLVAPMIAQLKSQYRLARFHQTGKPAVTVTPARGFLQLSHYNAQRKVSTPVIVLNTLACTELVYDDGLLLFKVSWQGHESAMMFSGLRQDPAHVDTLYHYTIALRDQCRQEARGLLGWVATYGLGRPAPRTQLAYLESLDQLARRIFDRYEQALNRTLKTAGIDLTVGDLIEMFWQTVTAVEKQRQ